MNFYNYKKTNKSEKDKLVIKNNETKNIESPKQKVKAPNSRPNTAPSSKKPPHRTFSNSSKKPGRTDWDDSAKLEALKIKIHRNKGRKFILSVRMMTH